MIHICIHIPKPHLQYLSVERHRWCVLNQSSRKQTCSSMRCLLAKRIGSYAVTRKSKWKWRSAANHAESPGSCLSPVISGQMDESIISRPIINGSLSLASSLTTAGKYHERMSECILMTQSICTPTTSTVSEWLTSPLFHWSPEQALWCIRRNEATGNVSHLMWPRCHEVGWEGGKCESKSL